MAKILKHTAHISAYRAEKKAGTLDTSRLGMIEAVTELPAPQPIAFLDIGASEIPGEALPLSDGEFEALMEASLDAGGEDAIRELDALYGEVEDEVSADEDAEQPLVDGATFRERYDAISDETRLEFAHALADRLDDRISRASDKSIKNLERARKKIVTGRVARTVAATTGDASFVNRVYHEGKEFNVYAFLKLADLVAGLVGDAITNAINIAVVKSMFALEVAGLPFEFDTAKAAASVEHTPQRPGVRAHLTRHDVAKGTASTQAGSTLHALAALGIVRLGRGVNYPITILDTPATTALREATFKEGSDE